MGDSFPVAFEEARKRAGLSRAEAAERLNVSLSTLKRWESGRSTPTVARKAAALDALDRGAGPLCPVQSRAAAAFLELARVYSGLSVRQAALRSDVSPSRWWRIESGETFVHRSTVAALARAAAPEAFRLATGRTPDRRLSVRALRAWWRRLDATGREAGECEREAAFCTFESGAYSTAARLAGFISPGCDPVEALEARAFSVWRGFPRILGRPAAARRARVLGELARRLPAERKWSCQVGQALFLAHAGGEEDGLRLIESVWIDDAESFKRVEAVTAWLHARCGRLRDAVALLRPHLDSCDPSTKFRAHRAGLEVARAAQSPTLVAEHKEALVAVSREWDVWAPSLGPAPRLQTFRGHP